MSVNFYENVDDELLKFAVIVSKTNGKWVFCKHKQRNTLEVPGGHREPNENIIDTARRELVEETGAVDFDLNPICVYSVIDKNNFNGQETFGLLCYADIYSLGEIDSEIEKIVITDILPENWTYPDIQPILIAELKKRNIA
ncbi:MAG: NUDIX domain-containing protein [Eubacterium sp.]